MIHDHSTYMELDYSQGRRDKMTGLSSGTGEVALMYLREKKGRKILIGFGFVIALHVVHTEEAIQKFPTEAINVKRRKKG